MTITETIQSNQERIAHAFGVPAHMLADPRRTVAPRYWSLCMTSENHGTVGPAGCKFTHAPDKHERVLVVEVPAAAGAPVDQVNLQLVGARRSKPVAEFNGYVDGEPAVTWLDRDNMPRVGTKLFTEATTNKAEVDLSSLLRSDWSESGMLPASEGTYVDFDHVEALLAAPPATTGSSTAPTDPSMPRDMAQAIEWILGLRARVDSLLDVIEAERQVGASTVLTDERIAFDSWAIRCRPNFCDAPANRAQQWIGWEARSKVAAQAGQVAVPEAVDGVRWELFPGYLIDHCEGDQLSEELLQHALASMLKDSKYLAAIAAAPSPAKE